MNKTQESKPNGTGTNNIQKPLSRKQIEAIPHLVGAGSLEAGRKKAGVAKTTLYQWLKDETFKAELERTREAVTREALDRLKGAITRAVEGLIHLAVDKNKSVRLRACEKVIDFFLKVREADEIECRLEKIERIILERRTYR